MFRRQVKVVEKRVTVPDWKSNAWAELNKGIRTEAAQHEPILWDGTIGDLGFANSFSCKLCHTTWPCRFIQWAHKLLGGRDDVFVPLRLQLVGEEVDGHGVRTLDGAWMRVNQPPKED